MLVQGEIVEYAFPLAPDGSDAGVHPCIVISNNALCEEGCYVIMMMTSTNQDDLFSFVLTKDMFTKHIPSKSGHSEARLNCIYTIFNDDLRHVRRRNSHLTTDALEELLLKIYEITFSTQTI